MTKTFRIEKIKAVNKVGRLGNNGVVFVPILLGDSFETGEEVQIEIYDVIIRSKLSKHQTL